MKQITISDIEAPIIQAIAADNVCQRLHEIVRNVLVAFQGKQITKRIQTAVQKSQPGWVVYLDTQYGMYTLRIWGGDTNRNSDNRFSVLLGYDSDPVFNIDNFERHNACSGSAALARNVGRVALLADRPRLFRLVYSVNQVLAAQLALQGQLADLGNVENPHFETWAVTKFIEETLK